MAKKENSSSLGGVPLDNQEYAGIPDSPIFVNPRIEMENPLLDLHVGGMLVRDMPIEQQHRLVYQQTDEGITEMNEGKSPHRIETVRDEVTKACEQRRDQITSGMEPWEANNPMAALERQHVRPGFKGKFLSPAKMAKEGGATGGYEIVKDERGDPVKLRNMPLGEMPIERVEKRNRFYRQKAADAAGEIKKNYLRDGGPTAVATDS